MQAIKDYLVRQGPNSRLTRAALWLTARLRGFQVVFQDGHILVRQGKRDVILRSDQYVTVPFMMKYHQLYFDTLVPRMSGGHEVLDFSRPAVHQYRRSGVALEFPALPEDDSIEAYTHWYMPRPGDVVWDAGAHAGLTTYCLAQLVGPDGLVFAFEPDEINFGYLSRNLEHYNLGNVVLVKKALAGHTGQVSFQMDGTMAAGIREYATYVAGEVVTVPTLTLPDACAELGHVPAYVKMDIEGAEVAVIENAAAFLRQHSMHFAIESDHRIGGKYTFHDLNRLFPALGYEVESSAKFGPMFTWARKAQVRG